MQTKVARTKVPMLFVMDSFKSSVLAAETMISFCNLLGVIQFAFDRKPKNPFVDADPGPPNPNCAELRTGPQL
jgi:hypothetical protein